MARVDRLKKMQKEMRQISLKVTQAVRIRAKLAFQRDLAYKAMDSDKKKALFVLNRCLKNEKKFMDIMEYGLKDGIKILKATRHELKNAGAKKQFIKEIDFVAWVMKYFNKKLNKIRKRMVKEEKFLKDPESMDYEDIIYMWEKEIKIDRKIATRISPARINHAKRAAELASSVQVAAVAGLAAGGMGGLLIGGMMGGASAAITAPVGAILAAAVGVVIVIVANEQEIADHHRNALRQIRAFA